jgi:hypothetical protein
VQEETLCPHCGQLTHTIMGDCPNCGARKVDHPPLAQRRPRYFWRYDFPGYDTDAYGIATWVRMIGLIVAAVLVAVFLFPWYYVLPGLAAAALWWWLLA